MFFENNMKRVYMVGKVTAVILILLLLRTGYIMLIWGKELSVMKNKQYTYEHRIGDLNYTIEDYNGKGMLNYIPKYYLIVDPDAYIRYNKDTDIRSMVTLKYILRNYNEKYNLDEVKPGMRERPNYEVDEETYNKLKGIQGIKGVYAFKRMVVDRTSHWNYENMLTDLFDGQKPKSKESIEGLIFEATKRNEYPKVIFEKGVSGEYSEPQYIHPVNNVNVRLTTDKEIQDEIKKILSQEKYKKYDQIGVVMMESATGKIKAMVQRDDWKQNIILCSATENGYEPGSIFKTLVAEAALENGLPASTTYTCAEDKKQHGTISMGEAYIVSCNTYFSRMGNSLGFSRILPLAKAQGLFKKVLNFHGNGEVTGDYQEPKPGDGTLTNLSIGQSMRITPIQALGMVNTVVNRGKYVKPYLIDSFIGEDDQIIKKLSTEEKQVLKISTAAIMKDNMIKVVRSPKGTGHLGYISNIETGGKTGTNTRFETRVSTDNNGNKLTETIKCSDGWFTGFYKVKGKYYSIVVFVKGINVNDEGAGTTAVPIFKEIVEGIQAYHK
jgi:cell division protein FtsI/penicillin-binding protein 2